MVSCPSFTVRFNHTTRPSFTVRFNHTTRLREKSFKQNRGFTLYEMIAIRHLFSAGSLSIYRSASSSYPVSDSMIRNMQKLWRSTFNSWSHLLSVYTRYSDKIRIVFCTYPILIRFKGAGESTWVGATHTSKSASDAILKAWERGLLKRKIWTVQTSPTHNLARAEFRAQPDLQAYTTHACPSTQSPDQLYSFSSDRHVCHDSHDSPTHLTFKN